MRNYLRLGHVVVRFGEEQQVSAFEGKLTHRLCEFFGERSKDHLASNWNGEVVLEEVTQASNGS
jgi:hypothetical protein